MKKQVARKKADNSSQRAETQRQNRMRKPTTTVSPKNQPDPKKVKARASSAKRIVNPGVDPELGFQGSDKAEFNRQVRSFPNSPAGKYPNSIVYPFENVGPGQYAYRGYPKKQVPLRPKKPKGTM